MGRPRRAGGARRGLSCPVIRTSPVPPSAAPCGAFTRPRSTEGVKKVAFGAERPLRYHTIEMLLQRVPAAPLSSHPQRDECVQQGRIHTRLTKKEAYLPSQRIAGTPFSAGRVWRIRACCTRSSGRVTGEVSTPPRLLFIPRRSLWRASSRSVITPGRNVITAPAPPRYAPPVFHECPSTRRRKGRHCRGWSGGGLVTIARG